MSTSHSVFGASGAHRWVECPASVRMEQGQPDQDSPYAAEGTLAHELAEAALRAGTDTAGTEMGDHVQVYLDYVRSLPGHLYVEQRVDYSHIVPDGYGTADAIVYDEDTATLYVVDLKYGQGVRVEAQENPQAMLYALGAIAHLSWLGDVEDVVLVVVQPRLDHISEWETEPSVLLEFGQRAAAAARNALSDTPTFNPGASQCRFCKASGHCKPQAQYNLQTAQDDFAEDTLRAVHELQGADLAWVLDRLKALQDWCKAVESRATSVIEAGEEIPGYKLVEGRSLRRWGDEREAEPALEAALGDDAWSRSLISPAQAEKLLGKKHDILGLIVKPPGKPTLVPESDKRPAIRTTAARDFAQ